MGGSDVTRINLLMAMICVGISVYVQLSNADGAPARLDTVKSVHHIAQPRLLSAELDATGKDKFIRLIALKQPEVYSGRCLVLLRGGRQFSIGPVNILH